MNSAVITGVSTGIGHVTTQFLLDKGYHVFGSVRKEDDARRCQDFFGANFTPLVFDVRDRESMYKAAMDVQLKIGSTNLSALINNAGIAVSGPLQYISSKEIQDQFDINVIGLINTTQAFLPLLGARLDNTLPPGRIINISSVAGTFTMPFQVPYAASKHAVESINEGLRRELGLYNIKVISIRPGPIKSEIWFKELKKDVKFDDTIYAPIWNQKNKIIAEKEQFAEPTIKVAEAVFEGMTATRPRLSYLVYGKPWKHYLAKWMPSRLMDSLLDRQMKKQVQKK